MKDIIPFDYDSHQIRIIQDEQGDPWWVAKDVCEILNLDSTHKVVERLDEDERKIIPVIDAIGREQDTWVVNEPGLYSLIIRSNKTDAKKFKRWITHSVLPTLRKTGKFEIKAMSELDLIIHSAQEMKRIKSRQLEQEKRISKLEAKSDHNSGYTGYFTITAWCKFNKIKISLDDAMGKGRVATRIAKEWGVGIGSVTDERFGKVNSYREDILEEVFGLVNAE